MSMALPHSSLPHLSAKEYQVYCARMTTFCQTCGECIGSQHHWIEDFEVGMPGSFGCKHCDARGEECPECFGDGCDKCCGEGIVQLNKG